MSITSCRAPAVPYVVSGATMAWRACRVYSAVQAVGNVAAARRWEDEDSEEQSAPRKSKMKNQQQGNGDNMPGDQGGRTSKRMMRRIKLVLVTVKEISCTLLYMGKITDGTIYSRLLNK